MDDIYVVIGAVALGFIGLGFVVRAMMQRALLELFEKNESQSSNTREETDNSVRNLLDDNRKQLDVIVGNLKDQLKTSQSEVRSLREQNAAISEQLKNTHQVTQQLQLSTDSLKELLSNNRLRGEWGEQVAEDLLLAAGFVEGLNYEKQTSTAEGRPDFTVLLPDGFMLNVDAKFPFDDLVRYQDADSAAEKKKALKSFETSIKTKVKEVTSKDYIDPGSQTVDFVVMFIPNEMIFSFIYEKTPSVVDYAAERKVVLSGPFGFTALLRLVLQAHRNFHYEKELQGIIGLIEKFQRQYEMYGENMDKLGRGLKSAQDAFEQAEGVRHRNLTRVVEKITEQSSDAKLLPEKEHEDE